MQVAVVHGYFLGDSGSGGYVRHLTSALLAESASAFSQCGAASAFGFAQRAA